MLLSGYDLQIEQAAACKPGTPPLYCVARLHDDIGAVLPYLNAVLPGIGFTREPPAMLLQQEGHQIAIQAREITISPVQDRAEAEAVFSWLVGQVNDVWERRGTIEPCFQVAKPITVIEILRFLPKTNCGRCGLPTCTVFAAGLLQGDVNMEDCPELDEASERGLRAGLAGAAAR